MRDTHILENLKVESVASTFTYTIYIDEDVEEVAYYRSILSTLGAAGEGDTVRMMINTSGGYVNTASAISYAMDKCVAKIIAIMTGDVHSAGTMIALHADEWEVGHAISWMAHTASFGVRGSAEKVKGHHAHEQELISNMLYKEYQGFYTKEEISCIADGKESWLTAEEVSTRLRNFANYRAERKEQALVEAEDALWDENNQLVDETVEKLDISAKEKETFLRIKALLDTALEEEDNPPAVEEAIEGYDTQEPDEYVMPKAIYKLTESITVDATQYPDGEVWLYDDQYDISLNGTTVPAKKDLVYFIEGITGVAPKKHQSKSTLTEMLLGHVEEFLFTVNK